MTLPLLKSVELASFVNQGYLRFDELVDRPSCEALLADVRSGAHWQQTGYGLPLRDVWPEGSALRRIFAAPRLRGIIESLLGQDPIYDHHFPHMTRGGERRADDLHQDAIFDRRPFRFDIQVALFPQDTPREAGGTLIVPGSHLRRVHESDIRRYQHIKGQQQIVCGAGTVVVMHHNLWHSGRSNLAAPGTERIMFKLRLQPSGAQYRTWDLSDVDAVEIGKILSTPQPWHGIDARMECNNRLLLWRALSGCMPSAANIPHYGNYIDRDT